MLQPEQVPGAGETCPRESWVSGVAWAGTTGHTGSLHSVEAHGQALHLQKKKKNTPNNTPHTPLRSLLWCL